MLEDMRIERFARAIGRRLTVPPARAVQAEHVRDITHALAGESHLSRNVYRFNEWVKQLPQNRRVVPAFAAAVLLVVVAVPLSRSSGTDLPVFSAASEGGPQAPMSADTMERGAMDVMPDKMWRAEQYVFVLADGVELPAGLQPAWHLRVDGSLSDRAEALRVEFGLSSMAPSEWDEGVLVAGDPEQASATLHPTGEWYFGNFPAYPQWSCPDDGSQSAPYVGAQVEPNAGEQVESDTSASARGSSGASDGGEVPEPYECTPPPAAQNLPSSAEAQRQASKLFTRLGITGLTFETPYRDAWTVSLWGTQRFDALPDYDYQGVSVTFGANGEILGAYGTFATPSLIGEYPTVSATDAVARLNAQYADAGSGALVRPMPAINDGDKDVANTDSADDDDMPTVEVTLLEVTIVPAPIWSPDGFSAIAPHYRFTDSNGQHWWVAAVTDRYLAG